MEINLNKAIKSLNDVDRQLKDMAKVPTQSGKTSAASLLSDSVDLSGAQNNGPIQSPSAQALYGEMSDQMSSLMSLVGDQAGRQKELEGMFAGAGTTDEVQQRARELLEGYFNAENTASRIFDFAFSFYDGSGDREAFAEERRANIYEGFRQAEKALGGLADISLETRDLIDQKIDDFISEGEEGSQDS